MCFEREVTAFLSLLTSGRTLKCCVGVFATYRSLVINRNESISDDLIDILMAKIKAPSKNDERAKRGAEEPGLLLYDIMLIILYLPPSL